MAEVQTIAAASRDRAGKGTARAARRAGQIPAVIYGNKEEPLLITVDRTRLEQELGKRGFFIRLLDVEVDGATHRVLPRDTQYHPVTDRPLHVDFLRYSADRKLTVEIPVHFMNEEESPGLKSGGVLNVVRHAIEVLCVADAIPDAYEIDLTGLEVGDSIHASTLTLTDGVELSITDRDFTIATIATASVMAVEEEVESEEGVEGEEGAEGEAAEGPGADNDKTEGGE